MNTKHILQEHEESLHKITLALMDKQNMCDYFEAAYNESKQVQSEILAALQHAHEKVQIKFSSSFRLICCNF